jgi:predicted Zn finger-like uncharacterized protein
MIAFTCTHCRTKLQRPDYLAGTPTVCDRCHQRLRTPVARTGPDPEPFDAGQFLLQADAPASRPKAAATSAASLRFSCPHCQAVIKGKADKAGLRVKCPKCSLPCEVPLPKGQLLDTVSTASDLPAARSVAPRPERAQRVPARSRWTTSRVVGCTVVTFVALTVLGVVFVSSQGRGAKGTVAASGPGPTDRDFTEAAVRDRLRKALDSWVAQETPQVLAQRHPDIDFAEPFFTDGANVLGYDIEEVQFYGAIGKSTIHVSMKYKRVDGGEGRYKRYYEVPKPDERGIWHISVSSHTPSAPQVSNAPGLAEARSQLKKVLDAWAQGVWKRQLSRDYPTINFSDLDYSDDELLIRYDLGKTEGPSQSGTWSFYVFLVITQGRDQRKNFRVLKVYEVDTPDDQGVWHIRGYRPAP